MQKKNITVIMNVSVIEFAFIKTPKESKRNLAFFFWLKYLTIKIIMCKIITNKSSLREKNYDKYITYKKYRNNRRFKH